MADGGDDIDRLHRLRLIRSANIGPVSYFQLIARFGSAAAALAAIPDLAMRGGGRAPRIADLARIEQEMAQVAAAGARYLFLGEADYPRLLAEIDSAPPALIVRGNPAIVRRPLVAIVGARNASAAGCRFARQLAQQLGDEGLVVVSGLARGIDTAAHTGALASGTIGVIASGIDIAYPPENAGLQTAIGDQGLLIAEQPPGTEPLARHFPSRNRIIAGMSLGTIVVEAAPRSGSLITARLAAEAGRDVMAVPGSPLDPRAQGCNGLIRDGAVLIQCAADVIDTIRPLDARMVRQSGFDFAAASPPVDIATADRTRVTGLLGLTPVAIDELVRQSGVAPAVVQTALLELELAGRLERHAGGRVSLA